VHVRELTLDHELAGNIDLQIANLGHDLQFNGKSQLHQGSLVLTGNVQLRDDYPAKISLQMDQVDLDALWRSYMKGRLTGHSAISGLLDLHGPLRRPGELTVDG